VVADQGIGIRAEDQTRIFDRFERANSLNRSGFGIGLWVVRQLCHAMGGDVQVSSRTGEGSTFTVTLPRKRIMER
jgi:signal transduction histidine kinase